MIYALSEKNVSSSSSSSNKLRMHVDHDTYVIKYPLCKSIETGNSSFDLESFLTRLRGNCENKKYRIIVARIYKVTSRIDVQNWFVKVHYL